LYFVDFDPALADAVRKGRAEFLRQFPSIVDYEERAQLAHPGDARTFERCKLDFGERERHAAVYALHQDLLRLRREHAAFRLQRAGAVDGSVLSSDALALRFFAGEPADDRVLIVNLGCDLGRRSFADPLLAPPLDRDWEVCWSSEDEGYGGRGTPALSHGGEWTVAGESALVLRPGVRGSSAAPGIRRRTA
jgi:maltooligosyltrehalose trehalohydrolase